MKFPIVIMGVAGSGKTTIGKRLAEQVNATFVDGDDYHPKQNIIKMRQGIPLNDEDRSIWLKDLNALLKNETTKGTHIILACSALKSMYRRLLSHNMLLSFVYLKIDRDTALKRLEEREHHFFSPSLLDDQFEMLEEPNKAIIIDARESVNQVVIKINRILQG